MAAPDTNEVIRNSKACVLRGRYAYLKTDAVVDPTRHFLVARDEEETTVVTEEANVGSTSYAAEEKWFRLIEIRVALPFLAPGFIAAVTRAIADRGLNVLVVSTFSKDYFLVRDEAIEAAASALRELGFSLSMED